VDFFARQEAARRTTRWLLLAFLVSVGLIVVAVDFVVATAVRMSDPVASPRAAVVLATFVVIAIIGGASLIKTLSLRAGGAVVARSLGGRRVDGATTDALLQRLHNVVEEMAIASGVPVPEVYVLENEDGINAFAAGNTPADAAIAVTRGAVVSLSREELQGVIGHEFSHVLNGDSRLYLRLLGLVFGLLVVVIVARIVLTFTPRGSRESRGRGGGTGAILLAATAIMVIGYIGVFFGRLLQAAVSRHRERLADASSVQFTRNPQGLRGALLKIAGGPSGSSIRAPQAEQAAHMFFAPGLSASSRTHPPIAERIAALDPTFRREQLEELAAAAWADAERRRLAASPAD
jgi:Zn-dependent protease with chaperone function